MTKTLGRLDPKTRIVNAGSHMIQTDGLSTFTSPLPNGKIITHMWTQNTTGGTVKYIGIDGNTYRIYLARDMGRVPVLFTKFIDDAPTPGALTAADLWWGRTANHMYDELI